MNQPEFYDMPRTWILTEETGSIDLTLSKLTRAEAIEACDTWARDGSYDTSNGTLWLTYRLRCKETGEGEDVDITLNPPEPDCVEGYEHDWQAPFEVVGGDKRNPGVSGHGGGVLIEEVCVRCGCGRRTDTWAQDFVTGRQGLESVTYAEDEHVATLTRLRVRGNVQNWEVCERYVDTERSMQIEIGYAFGAWLLRIPGGTEDGDDVLDDDVFLIEAEARMCAQKAIGR